MPLSEIHQIPKRRHELFSSNLHLEPEHEFVELLWENGQIVTQGQSGKAKKTPPSTTISSNPSKAFEKDGGDHVLPKLGRYESNLDPSMTDLSSSGHIGLVPEDNMVPWLRYPTDDSLPKGHCPDFLSETRGINMNSFSAQNSVVPIDRNRNYSQAVQGNLLVRTNSSASVEQGNSSKTVVGVPDATRMRSGHLLYSTTPPSSVPNLKSKISSFTTGSKGGSDQDPCAKSVQTQPASSAPTHTVAAPTKDPKPLQPNNGSSGVMNFSHFSRPAAIVRAHLQSIDRLKSDERVRLAKSSHCIAATNELALGGSACGRRTDRNVAQPPHLPADVDWEKSPIKSLPAGFTSGNRLVNLGQEDPSKSNRWCRSPDEIPSSSIAAKKVENGKAVEPVVASSSVCSGGNSAGAAPNDPKHGFKRKGREMEESECHSEDVEDESVEARKPTSGRGSSAKRSRAAEVHNLSERRRRDRINEKMRALQELIPNCNKVDKASMLDEAIEYLKTLQLQLQIMSMGAGLCMPPMILPAGMPPMHMPHIPHLSPLGVGIGMGMGVNLGMGMVDMGATSGRPLIPVSPMPGAQFPYSSIPGPSNLQRMPVTSLQMFGIPGQAFPTSLPRGPYIPLPTFTGKVASAPDTFAASGAPPLTDSSAPPSSSKDLTDSLNVLAPASTQPTKDCGEQLDLMEGSDPKTRGTTN